ncbi:hypothetical protein IG631_22482 [Alternaria alternata]|nr:hypothetical protein IG631_22482 [Alternaria alternata]
MRRSNKQEPGRSPSPHREGQSYSSSWNALRPPSDYDIEDDSMSTANHSDCDHVNEETHPYFQPAESPSHLPPNNGPTAGFNGDPSTDNDSSHHVDDVEMHDYISDKGRVDNSYECRSRTSGTKTNDSNHELKLIHDVVMKYAGPGRQLSIREIFHLVNNIPDDFTHSLTKRYGCCIYNSKKKTFSHASPCKAEHSEPVHKPVKQARGRCTPWDDDERLMMIKLVKEHHKNFKAVAEKLNKLPHARRNYTANSVSLQFYSLYNAYKKRHTSPDAIMQELSTGDRATDPHTFMVKACETLTSATEKNLKDRLEVDHPDWLWGTVKCAVSKLRCFSHRSSNGEKIWSHVKTKCREKTPIEFCVRSRPRRAKKKFVVPPPPEGITFFRSLSRRPLAPGEVISESEDGSEDGYIHSQMDAAIEKSGHCPTSKQFFKFWNKFVYKENLQSDMHVKDTVIRFAQEYAFSLSYDDTSDEFGKKLDQLVDDEMIPAEVRNEALKIALSQQSSTVDLENDGMLQVPVREDTDMGLAHIILRNDRCGAMATQRVCLTPAVADSDGNIDMCKASPRELLETPADENVDPPYGLCYCGKDALSGARMKEIVVCKETVGFNPWIKVHAGLLTRNPIGLYTEIIPYCLYTGERSISIAHLQHNG